jgi:hypothetical protein
MRSAYGLRVVTVLLALPLTCATVRAQQGVSLSEPLSGPIGQPIYSQSNLTGPSNSLIPGDNNLTNPYIRNGVSDPLGFLIESSSMSPYAPEQSIILSYPDTEVHSDLVNDSTVAARFSEYRDNRLLMSGAGANTLRTGRAAAVGSGLSASVAGGSGGAAASSAFSRVGMLAPFAAGSSSLAARQSGMSGNATFSDPNAVVALLTSSSALSGLQGGMAGASGPTGDTGYSGMDSSNAGASGVIDPNADTMSMSLSAIPLEALVPPATSPAYGPAPGGIFPDVSSSMQSATGFQDSTMGTAGLPAQSEASDVSPLLSSRSDSISGPFADMSSEATHFLSPTLVVRSEGIAGADSTETGQVSGVSLDELKRKARLHALIYNPGAPLPSPFEERAMEKAYLRQQSGHQSHYPKLLAPSVTP